MPHPILYVAVTNHGFGHATRTASVVAELQRLCPDITVIFTTTAPRWLLDTYLSDSYIHRPRSFDVGVIQQDSLIMDKPATLEKLQHIRQHAAATIASEATFLKQNRVSLVLADIPPLATAIAHAADVPCWMMSNFGWDYIYRDWGGEFVEIADWVGSLFQQCDRLFRLPFHEPMSAFPNITDVGLTGGNPKYSAAELRDRLNLTKPVEQTILLTFGGLGIEKIPYERLTQFPDWQFMTLDANAPALPNLRCVDGKDYRPVDLMPVCGRVVSKPGYSTFAEACRLEIPVCTVTRRDFPEAAVLLAALENYAYHQIIEPADLLQGDWAFLRSPVQPPKTDVRFERNGATAIAQAVIQYLLP
ncbi:MAG: glycosyl transferase [Synechococcales cyanobacterium T60_A2020_003]|nr:glycosyl transferase [Synechococcales cyanobacterium T60_A2020_003]